ncbi:MAG: DegT/DnrJ/EryC1/StrS aminotransferase family protein, partial [Arenimonas sp.]|uniref:DegT/DnrJ/EryC1/StrS family aminotransferase n=1 Tax=Arenimonas sp. TaxID=1872635 RepID=UPI0025C192FC
YWARVCGAWGGAVLEDCAQSHGATDATGRRAGAFGDIASFSFYPTKNLGALGDGGAVVTARDDLAQRVRQLRQYGWSDKYTNTLSGGRNSRLDEMQARMLSLLLPSLDGWNQRRREIANRYSNEIRSAAIDVTPAAGDEFVGHLYVVRTDRRDDLRAHLKQAGVQTDVHYPRPDHRQPMHAGRFDAISLPETERDADRVLTLPCFPELADAEVDRVVQACNRF